MKKIFIISGHGNYATGVQSTLELLSGKNEDLFFIDFTADDTDATLKDKFAAIIDKNRDSEILFICDILGGTPFKVAAEISNASKEMELVVGCNISGILETLFIKDNLSLVELADKMVEVSKNSALRFGKIDVNVISAASVPEGDGI